MPKKSKYPFARMKNPKFTPEQEERIDKAERLSTRATILELGVGEFLKSHMPCAMDVEEAQFMLSMSIDWRKKSRAIHDSLDVNSRPGKSARSTGK